MYNSDMNFSWDPKKAKDNLKKHKISFEEAVTVFYDPLAKVAEDPDHSQNEDRYLLIGYSQKSHLLFVVHVYKEDDESVRIISARKATKNEKKDFEEL
jgi:uncharacterized DUF497 family protein